MSNISSYENKNQCAVDNCDSYEKHIKESRGYNFRLSKGYCNVHYKRIIRHGSTDKKPRVYRTIKSCKIDECKMPGKLNKRNGKRYFNLGYCSAHYLSLYKYGDASRAERRKHIEDKSLYRTYAGMIQRCYNTNSPYYYRYGGRGIKVCDRWLESFDNFLEDMGERPSSNHSLDRINNDGNYEPNNCRWATASQQAGNRVSNNRTVGVSYSKERKSWVAYMTVNSKTVLRQRFPSEKQAIKARRLAEKEFYEC